MASKLLMVISLAAGVLVSSECPATSLLQDSYISLVATTDRGDQIAATSDGVRITSLRIKTCGAEVEVGIERFDGFSGPYLQNAKLLIDSEASGRERVRLLVIPFFEYRGLKNVSFVARISSGRLVESFVIEGDNLDRRIESMGSLGVEGGEGS